MTRYLDLMRQVPDTSVPLSEILLRARLLAKELGNDEFQGWVLHELNGYANSGSAIPDYRQVPIQYFGHFHGPRNASVKNQPLSTVGFPSDVRYLFETRAFVENVGAIESLYSEATGYLVDEPPSTVLEAFRRYGEQIPGYHLNYIHARIAKAALAGVIHSIRTRLLEFLIQLAELFPELELEENAAKNLSPESVSEVTGRTIFNNCNVFTERSQMVGDSYAAGQVGAMGPQSHAHDMTFTQVWNKSSDRVDLTQLASELRGLLEELRREATEPSHTASIGNVEAAIQAAQQGDGPGVLRYMTSAGPWVRTVASQVGVGVAVELIVEMLKNL